MSGSAARPMDALAQQGKTLVPPDGGYGWVIAGAYALNNIFVLPLISGMGLVFKDTFEDLHISATQGSLIITLNHGLGMLLSFFGGPVLSRFGYRLVAGIGALFVVSGVMMISVANGFGSLLFAYSIMASIGVASVMAAFTLAINSFFKEKRSKAIGLGMSVTGLGPILMPHLMNLLLYQYGWRYASLTLAALCLHSLVAALLLRPVKWYMKEASPAPPVEEELQPLQPQNDDTQQQSLEPDEVVLPKVLNGAPKLPAESAEFYHEKDEDYLDSPKRINLSMRSLDSGEYLESRNAVSHPDVRRAKAETELSAPSGYKWWESQEVNLGSSINIFNERVPSDDKIETEVDAIKVDERRERGCGGVLRQFLHNVVIFFDLGLLKDPIFVNILLGLSIGACAEINFSLLMPFILHDMTFSTSEIAILLSIIGFTDMLFRPLSPFIADWCGVQPRIMYLSSLGMIMITRTVMLFASTFVFMVCVAVAIGATKGIRTVYMNVVIPSYVPIERLPFASGIQMLVNGIFLICFGPLLGVMKDSSGSYRLPIIILNVVTMLTVAMWTSEFIYFRCKKQLVVSHNTRD